MTLEELESLGIHLTLDSRGIRFDGPAEVLTDELMAEMKRHRPILIYQVIRRNILEYPPAKERKDGKPYIGPLTKELLERYLSPEELHEIKVWVRDQFEKQTKKRRTFVPR